MAAIDKLLGATEPKPDLGRPRLPIDRIFTMAGSGTVVTGTLIDGSLAVGQEVEVVPSGLKSRLRGLQTHKSKIDKAGPGSRVSANLVGINTSQLQRGDVVNGTYTVKMPVGRGAFGEVYRVEHRFLGSQALKVMPAPQAGVEKALNEAKILASLSDPHIVRVFEANTLVQDGREYCYIVMEFVPGESLAARLRRALPSSRICPAPATWSRRTIFSPSPSRTA